MADRQNQGGGADHNLPTSEAEAIAHTSKRLKGVWKGSDTISIKAVPIAARPKSRSKPGPRNHEKIYSDPSDRADADCNLVIIEMFAGVGTGVIVPEEVDTVIDTKIGKYYLENDGRDPTKYLARNIRRRDSKAIIWEDVNELIDNSCNRLKGIMQHHLSQNPDCKFLIIGEFPCQDLSRAGPQKGLTGTSSPDHGDSSTEDHIKGLVHRRERRIDGEGESGNPEQNLPGRFDHGQRTSGMPHITQEVVLDEHHKHHPHG